MAKPPSLFCYVIFYFQPIIHYFWRFEKFPIKWKRKTVQTNMIFLFAGHSDKPLKSLISMAHKGNHICLHRFSFIYVMDDLWEDAYTCPVNVMNCTTRSAIYVMELRVMGWVPIKGGDDKMRSFSMSCDSPIIKGHSSRSLSFDYCHL